MQHQNTILIGTISVIAAVSGALVTELFEASHIGAVSNDYKVVQMQSKSWGIGYWDKEWKLSPIQGHENDEYKADVWPPRAQIYHIKFPGKFLGDPKDPPIVYLSVTAIDAGNESKHIAWWIRADNVDLEGFDITIQALQGSIIYSFQGQWLALK
jgi:hypothetical protein